MGSAQGPASDASPRLRRVLALLPLAVIAFIGFGPSVRAGLWVTGYYPGYRQSYLPPSAIDFSALTHIIHFCVMPNANGSLDASVNGITPAYSTALVSAAHAGGIKALICVGGAGSETGFQGATASTNLTAFITNLTNFASTYGYDGIDVDWEPLPASDAASFTSFINALRTALNARSPTLLLTVATASQPSLFASLQNQFDQINLMTYDLAGPWPGWVTWFNSPLFDGGYRFSSTGGLIPSTDGMVTNFLGNGVAAGKLAIGTAFYGMVWTHGAGTSTGGTLLPRQSWTTVPTVTAYPYSVIISNYFQTNLYHWDTAAQAAWLSITNTPSTNDLFISYDDERSCQAKVSYARNHFLGGLMIWELGQGYFATLPAPQRAPLLQSIKSALTTPAFTSAEISGSNVVLTFTTLPLASYRVSWSPSLSDPAWSTLITGVSGSGQTVQAIDYGAATNPVPRFYRLQTPP